jgi:hypothetical protein
MPRPTRPPRSCQSSCGVVSGEVHDRESIGGKWLTVEGWEGLVFVFVAEGLHEILDCGLGAVVAAFGGLVEEMAFPIISMEVVVLKADKTYIDCPIDCCIGC